MAKCRGCGVEMGSIYDRYCGECNKIRWTTVFILVLACVSGLFAIFKSNAILWILGLMLVFYAWLYKDRATNQRAEELISSNEDSIGRQFIENDSNDDDRSLNEARDSYTDIL